MAEGEGWKDGLRSQASRPGTENTTPGSCSIRRTSPGWRPGPEHPLPGVDGEERRRRQANPTRLSAEGLTAAADQVCGPLQDRGPAGGAQLPVRRARGDVSQLPGGLSSCGVPPGFSQIAPVPLYRSRPKSLLLPPPGTAARYPLPVKISREPLFSAAVKLFVRF